MPHAEVNGIRIYYEQTGEGPDLLLVCGLGATLQCWAPQRAVLAERFRLTLFDNRGVGGSDAPDEAYSIRQMADDAAALLDVLGIARAHVLGTSMGGMIGQELAIEHPAKVDRLVLACTRGRAGAIRRLMSPVSRTLWTQATGIDRVQRALLTMPWSMTANFMSDDEKVLAALEGVRADPSPIAPHAYLRQHEACIAHDCDDRLARIVAQTLVLVGREDVLTPVAAARALASRIQRAKLEILPRGGHGFFMEYAEDVNRAVLAFLA